MSDKKIIFRGFSEELLQFLSDLEKNNNIEWFHNNRSRYEKFFVEPARAYVTELAPFLNRFDPAIRTEPKFNQTIMRINKDMRFSKGVPYKTYLLVHFGRFKMDSEFFLYFEPQETQIGIFLNNSDEDQLYFNKNFSKYKNEIVKVFDEYKLNNKFSFYTMDKKPVPSIKKFNAEKHIDKLGKSKYILLQKVNPPKSKIFSDNLLPYSVQIFSSLYPLLCFAYSSNPMKELDRYRENFGIML